MLNYTKLQKLLIVIIIAITLASCENNKIELTQEQYKELIGDTIKPEYPKYFKIDYTGLGYNNDDDGIVLGSDKHEYLVTSYNSNAMNTEHYVDCIKCKKDTL